MSPPPVSRGEIRCSVCGKTAMARPEPVYDGLRKTGEVYVCTACGHRYPSRAETPFTAADNRPRVFDDADRPVAPRVFRDAERRRSCGWCRHFVVNPFSQRCGLTNRPVESTDVCARFSAKPEEKKADGSPAAKPADPLERFFGKT